MSKYWGPLGWMTLHSISLNYPDNPLIEDKQILLRFMNNFTESITCPSCQSHFKTIFQSYIGLFPDWNASKHNLFIFIARAHNTVNKRLDKPLIRTVSDCLETLEEIAMEGKEDFLEAGGTDYKHIPCMNDNDDWVDVMVKWINDWENK